MIQSGEKAPIGPSVVHGNLPEDANRVNTFQDAEVLFGIKSPLWAYLVISDHPVLWIIVYNLIEGFDWKSQGFKMRAKCMGDSNKRFYISLVTTELTYLHWATLYTHEDADSTLIRKYTTPIL